MQAPAPGGATRHHPPPAEMQAHIPFSPLLSNEQPESTNADLRWHPDRLIKIDEVLALTGLGKTKVYNMAKCGNFPPPLKIGPRASAFRLGDIIAWNRSRPRSADVI